MYPWGAVLNHSCAPNCLVRWNIRQYHLPILEFVACTHITPGTELCHSYIDLMSNTQERRQSLQQNYNIRLHSNGSTTDAEDDTSYNNGCGCKLIPWPTATINTKDVIFDALFWKNILDQHYSKADTTTIEDSTHNNKSWDEIYNNEDIKDTQWYHELLYYSQQANAAFQNDDDDQELFFLSQAVAIIDGNNNNNNENENERNKNGATTTDSLVPFYEVAYAINCRYLSCCMVHGDLNRALLACERIVCTIMLAMIGHNFMLYHPLLGVQLYTLADLYEHNSNSCSNSSSKEKATTLYRWARSILIVTHGEHNELVQRLNAFL